MNNYFFSADILLPKNNFQKWSCIACDQYTSEPEYWEKVKEFSNGAPSALNIILPEVYLKNDNTDEIDIINKTMKQYIADGVFNLYENSIFYTERKLKDGKLRRGLVGLIDLNDYSYEKGAKTPIRATEATVIERIPPRVKIRQDAVLEIPHIMLLIDDVNGTVIEPQAEKIETAQKVYDFTLMLNAGEIKGYKLTDNSVLEIQKALSDLKEKSSDGLLFAVGDGNHSLATAKECYKLGKGSRYALVEVVNIHDASLEFEPIYRVLFNVEPEKIINDFIHWCGGEYTADDAQKFTCVYKNYEKTIFVKPKGTLAVATLQTFLDEYIKSRPEILLDYIHGIDSTKKLSQKDNALGFLFDGMEKSDLFTAVSCDGSLPRKTFSMGSADDKRFYLEARKI